MYNLAVVPIMLSNAGTWDELNTKSIVKLNDIQNTLLRYLLLTPRTTATCAMNWDFGTEPVEYKIMTKKLTLMYHIATLDEDTLAREIFEAQKLNGFPGLIKSCQDDMKKLNLPDITDPKVNKEFTKKQWKTKVKNAVRSKCEEDLKQKILTYSKLKNGPMSEETFSTKEYLKTMNVSDARINFSRRSFMYDVKWNYRSNPKYAADLWRCDSCENGHIESQSHILFCEAYSDLRKDKDINNIEHLVEYMKKVLTVRDNLKLTK